MTIDASTTIVKLCLPISVLLNVKYHEYLNKLMNRISVLFDKPHKSHGNINIDLCCCPNSARTTEF